MNELKLVFRCDLTREINKHMGAYLNPRPWTDEDSLMMSPCSSGAPAFVLLMADESSFSLTLVSFFRFVLYPLQYLIIV